MSKKKIITKRNLQKILDIKGLKQDISSLPDDAKITDYDLSKEPISITYTSKNFLKENPQV